MTTSLKQRVRESIELIDAQLTELGDRLHAEPETAFQEHRAAELLADLLTQHGFDVQRGSCDLPTALVATRGSGDLNVGFCAEYDALPELGHACGHNLIAASSVGAAIATAAVAEELGIRVTLVGTPAEEHGGGKVLMLERGAFNELTVAMMAHPGAMDVHPEQSRSWALSRFAVNYAGRAAHAGAGPHLGINAADAAIIGQVSLGLLRQQLSPKCRVSGFIKESGQVTNIIPDRAEVEIEVRSETASELVPLKERVMACFRAGAVAAGATMHVRTTEPDLAELRQDPWLGARYHENIVALGRNVVPVSDDRAYSTDMGNVSQVVPSIHPLIGIRDVRAHPHSREFAESTVGEAAHEALHDAALALAWTAVDLAGDPTSRGRYVAAHAQRQGRVTPADLPRPGQLVDTDPDPAATNKEK